MARRLELQEPVTPFHITQRFAEDLTCVDSETRTKCVTRVAGETCPAGYESLYASSKRKGHDGIDLDAEVGQPVYAAMSGRVVELSDDTERGLGIGILSYRRFAFDPTEGSKALAYRAKTRYWHLSKLTVELDDRVRQGDLIGYAGSTGLSSGPHLHFEVKPQRRTILNSFVNAFPANGYKGAVDPESYFIHGA